MDSNVISSNVYIGLYFQKFLQDSVDFYLEMWMNSNGKDWFEGIPTCFTEF